MPAHPSPTTPCSPPLFYRTAAHKTSSRPPQLFCCSGCSSSRPPLLHTGQVQDHHQLPRLHDAVVSGLGKGVDLLRHERGKEACAWQACLFSLCLAMPCRAWPAFSAPPPPSRAFSTCLLNLSTWRGYRAPSLFILFVPQLCATVCATVCHNCVPQLCAFPRSFKDMGLLIGCSYLMEGVDNALESIRGTVRADGGLKRGVKVLKAMVNERLRDRSIIQ